jgi:hypothetical protein
MEFEHAVRSTCRRGPRSGAFADVPSHVLQRELRGAASRLRAGVAQVANRLLVLGGKPGGGETNPARGRAFPRLDQALVDAVELIRRRESILKPEPFGATLASTSEVGRVGVVFQKLRIPRRLPSARSNRPSVQAEARHGPTTREGRESPPPGNGRTDATTSSRSMIASGRPRGTARERGVGGVLERVDFVRGKRRTTQTRSNTDPNRACGRSIRPTRRAPANQRLAEPV